MKTKFYNSKEIKYPFNGKALNLIDKIIVRLSIKIYIISNRI